MWLFCGILSNASCFIGLNGFDLLSCVCALHVTSVCLRLVVEVEIGCVAPGWASCCAAGYCSEVIRAGHSVLFSLWFSCVVAGKCSVVVVALVCRWY